MNTPKIIHYKHKKYSDGTNPIIFQIIKNGKPIRKVIGRCKPEHWIASKCRVSAKDINSYRINEDIENSLKNYGVSKKYSFQQAMENQIEIYRNNDQVARHIITSNVLAQIRDFKPDVDFYDFTEPFIYKFANYLKNRKRANNPNTIREKMQVLGKIFKAAKKAKVIAENPFEDIIFPKQKSIKGKLSLDEMKRWISTDFKKAKAKAEVRDFITAMIYLRGIRIGDAILLANENVVDGRIVYREQKTGKIRDIKIRPELQVIIDRWSGKNKHGYLFSFMTLARKNAADYFELKKFIDKARSKVSRYVKVMAEEIEITKNVTPHTIRHSFSKLANQVIKNTLITKDLVGHETLEIHEDYISDISDNDELDSHADQVLDKLKD